MDYRDFTSEQIKAMGRAALEPAPEWLIDFIKSREVATFTQHRIPDCSDFCYFDRNKALLVICSGRVEEDGKRWIHVSCSRRGRLPSWDDLKKVKHVFLGREAKAIQILPPEDQYVNFHPYVLHLWTCLDGDPLPDLRKDGMI